MKSFLRTDVGLQRNINQDYVFASEKPIGGLKNLFVVADGMGGHQAGDFASKYTVEILTKIVANETGGDVETIIKQAVKIANRQLIQEAAAKVEYRGMGTTLVVATIDEDKLCFANIGDSRLYLLNDHIKQLSKDHSWVEELVRLGGINEEDAKHHPDKNIITRAIGIKEDVEVDFFEYTINKGDIILMCTDGLSNMIEDEEIFQLVKSGRDIVESTENLIKRANESGGKDNIGVILIDTSQEEVDV